MLDYCIVHGFGYLGSRIVGLIEGTREVPKDWKPIQRLPFRIGAIVDHDSSRLDLARASHPSTPCFADLAGALEHTKTSRTFVKDFTSPVARVNLLKAARAADVPVLLEKPLSIPGFQVPGDMLDGIASVSMSEAFNPVVRALAAKLAAEARRIENFVFVRVNTLTVQRLCDPSYRRDIVGGAFVDKLIHDIHLIRSGVILPSTEVEFGCPRILDIAFDLLRSQEGAPSFTFSKLGGAPLSPREAATSRSGPAEMMVDLTLPVTCDGREIQTRWIASWCGVPSDLATRIGIAEEHIRDALLVTPRGSADDELAALPLSNLKLITCRYVSKEGRSVQLIANIQARGRVGAWLAESRDHGAFEKHPVRYSVPVVESMAAFAEHFENGAYLDIRQIREADEMALNLRSQFRRPRPDELSVARSLDFLHRFNSNAMTRRIPAD